MRIEYERAKRYLSRSKTAASLIEEIEKSTMVHTIIMPKGANFYDPYEGALGWNPNYGLAGYPAWLCGPGSDYWLSPAMRLLHELGHAQRVQSGHFKPGLSFIDSYQQRKREEIAVLEMENKVASELGLRTDITPRQRYFDVYQKHR